MSELSHLIGNTDLKCFLYLNHNFRSPAMTKLMKGATRLGSTPFTLLIMIATFSLLPEFSGILAQQLFISQMIIHTLKRLINRPRPYLATPFAQTINPPKCRYSLPSGHTGAAFTLALCFSSLIPAFALPLVMLAVLVGYSRIYLGCHYPLDVVAGLAVSLCTFLSI